MHITCPIATNGPLISALVFPSLGYRQALIAAKQPVPQQFAGNFLIDTGASSTVLDLKIVAALSLPVRGSSQVHTPTTGCNPVNVNQFDIDIVFQSQNGNAHLIDNLLVFESDFSAQGISGLIGRDILSQARLTYSGTDNIALLSF